MERDLSVPGRAIGDPARARMLTALLGGASLTAGELAGVAGVAPSTASEHLALLVASGLVEVRVDGRHRRHALSGPHVARALEALQALAPEVPVRSLRGHRIASDLVTGRTCYDHLAGGVGLRVTDLLVRRAVLRPLAPGETVDHLERPDDRMARDLGLADLAPGRRPLARGCLDWSGRRAHVAGAVGARVLEALSGRGWVRARSGSRAVVLSEDGEAALSGYELEGPAGLPACSACTPA